jgi:hypothetical protein
MIRFALLMLDVSVINHAIMTAAATSLESSPGGDLPRVGS